MVDVCKHMLPFCIDSVYGGTTEGVNRIKKEVLWE